MRDVAKRLLEYAKKAGTDQSEVYIVKSTEHEIRTSKMKLEAIKQATTNGIALRVLSGGKLRIIRMGVFGSIWWRTWSGKELAVTSMFHRARFV